MHVQCDVVSSEPSRHTSLCWLVASVTRTLFIRLWVTCRSPLAISFVCDPIQNTAVELIHAFNLRASL